MTKPPLRRIRCGVVVALSAAFFAFAPIVAGADASTSVRRFASLSIGELRIARHI